MAAKTEGFQVQADESSTIEEAVIVPNIYPSWSYRFRDIFKTYQPVYEKLNILSKVYDATTIYKSRYFGYNTDEQLARSWTATQDKRFPLATVLDTGEPTLTTATYTMDKVYGFMANQIFVEAYRAIDLDISQAQPTAWPNCIGGLQNQERPFLTQAGGQLPYLLLNEDFPFVRLDANSKNAFTFTNTAISTVHSIQWRIPQRPSGVPTPILEYVSAPLSASSAYVYIYVNVSGNLECSWSIGGSSPSYTSPKLIASNTWYSLFIDFASTPNNIALSVSPFDSPTPFDNREVFEITGILPTLHATLGRNGSAYTSIDIYQTIAYMGIYTSSSSG